MQAAKACDAYGLIRGNSVQQADAEQAYVQTRLGGKPTDKMPAEVTWTTKTYACLGNTRRQAGPN
jgi:hypothetical protein